MKEVLVTAKPAGKLPDSRLEASCRSARFRKAGPTDQLSGMLPVSWFSFRLLRSKAGGGGSWGGVSGWAAAESGMHL